MVLPKVVIHADWSLNPAKRWLVRAELGQNGRYRVGVPQQVPLLDALIEQLVVIDGSVLFGLDLPLGLPLAYARQIGCVDFVEWLRCLPEDDLFYRVAERPEEIGLARPFYPKRPGGTRQHYLLDGLNVEDMNQLRRRCDLPTETRRAAAPLFWTMGAQQVGKAALVGWREFVRPLLNDTRVFVKVWPFDGEFATLITRNTVVLVEAYPAEFYGHLGVGFERVNGRKWGKRVQTDRQEKGEVLVEWADREEFEIAPEMQRLLLDGFGGGGEGEDQFDAAVGVLGMLNVVLGNRKAFEPKDEEVCKVEGWILGMVCRE